MKTNSLGMVFPRNETKIGYTPEQNTNQFKEKTNEK